MASSATNIWELAGVSSQEFHTNLFLISAAVGGHDGANLQRHHEQITSEASDESLLERLKIRDANEQYESGDEEDEENENDKEGDAPSAVSIGALSHVRSQRLLDVFLDRVAELASTQHGGENVASSMIEGASLRRFVNDDEGLNGPESNEPLRLHLAKNSPFETAERLFLEQTFPTLIGDLASAQQRTRRQQIARQEELLREAISQFSWKRVAETYIPKFIAAYAAFIAAHENDDLTHSLSKELRQLASMCQTRNADQFWLNEIVVESYRLRSADAVMRWWRQGQTSVLLRKVLTCLMFLGRPRAAFEICLKLCSELPELRNLQVICHDYMHAAPRKACISSFQECQAAAGNKLKSDGLQEWHRKFSRETLYVHSEVQLAFLMFAIPEKHSYIGGSKRPCLLCHMFFEALNVRSKMSHYSLAIKWSLPQIDCSELVKQPQMSVLCNAVSITAQNVASLLGEVTSARYVPIDTYPQSTAGVTMTEFATPSRSFQAGAAENFRTQTVSRAQAMEQQEFEAKFDVATQRPGPCDVCGRHTNRSCSICKLGRICVKEHEKQYNRQHQTSCMLQPQIRSRQASCCAVCGQQPAYPCRQCRSVAYCSVACCSEDKGLHTITCADFCSVRNARPEPSEDFRLCFNLLETEKRLDVCWVTIRPHYPEDYTWSYFETLELKERLELNPGISLHQTQITQDVARVRQLDRMVMMYYNEDFLNDGSYMNACVQWLAGSTVHTWRGPIIFSRQESPCFGSLSGIPLDVRLEDLTAGLAELRGYGETYSQDPEIPRGIRITKPRKVVRINCDNHVEALGGPRFEDRIMQDWSYRFHVRKSEIAEQLGIPLYSFQERVHADPQVDPMNVYDSVRAKYLGPLHQRIDLAAGDEWGWFDPFDDLYPDYFGNHFVYREDGGEISARLVRNVCRFCKDLQKVFERTMDPTVLHPLTRGQAMEAINLANFENSIKMHKRKRDTWTEQGLAPWEI